VLEPCRGAGRVSLARMGAAGLPADDCEGLLAKAGEVRAILVRGVGPWPAARLCSCAKQRQR